MNLDNTDYHQKLRVFYGDLHNHCGLSYGRGSLKDALRNARLQLDFVSVTVHAAWPDIPHDDPELEYLVDYHERGFHKAQQNWPDYLAESERQNVDGEFLTFPSFEWHSIEYGDYCVYFRSQAPDHIIDAGDLPTLRAHLEALTTPTMLIPHHIGYKQGYRGINWNTFTDKLSPVVEIFSFHGLSESTEGPYPYLHSMGPRHHQSTAQYGWAFGHRFGVIGSTDHHNAHPGSYGYGRLGVWAEALTREAVWDAIQNRRTYALTGDRIRLDFRLNGEMMGSVCPGDDQRQIAVHVEAGDAIDYIDVLHNNHVVHRESVLPHTAGDDTFKVYVELGWGEKGDETRWNIDLQILHGRLLDVEPRLRGYGPTDTPDRESTFNYSSLDHTDDHHVRLQTRTRQNTSLHTASTEGMALEINGNADTRLIAQVNGQTHELSLADLLQGAQSIYLGGFVSPAVSFHRAVARSEYTHQFTFDHYKPDSTVSDWYYVRVRQKNDQWAWSSPIWIENAAPT